MTDLNELRRLVEFYNQNGPEPLVSGVGGDSTSAWNAKLRQRNALGFAQSMMGPQIPSGPEPDYFALADRFASQAPQAPMAPRMMGPRMAGGPGGNNYLARLVGGSYGR